MYEVGVAEVSIRYRILKVANIESTCRLEAGVAEVSIRYRILKVQWQEREDGKFVRGRGLDPLQDSER